MPSLTAPQPPPAWDHTADDIIRVAKELIEQARQAYNKIAETDPKDCNFESVFVQLAKVEADLDEADRLTFYQNVSPLKELRDAATEAEVMLKEFYVDMSMRVDVFMAKKYAEENIKAQGVKLSTEEQRLVEKMLLEGKRRGLDLPEDKRTILTEKMKQVSNLCTEFRRNFNEEKETMTFTEKEIEGVPADVVAGYQKNVDGPEVTYTITHKYPDYVPLVGYARNPETRKKAVFSYEARLEKNVPLLAQILALRREITSILNYSTWADYITEIKMVKSAKNVQDFLNDLEQRLRPVGLKNRETLLSLKQKEHEELGYPFDGEFYLWDYRYYDQKYKEEVLAVDENAIKEYFPVAHVVPTVLRIYQDLLSVRFEPMQAKLWHPDTELFSVWNADATDENGFIGYCYLDLFPREAKYGHAAVWPLVTGYDKPDEKRNCPVAAMVANLGKPTSDRPALMRHDDVVTFFHEMGHVFHGLLSKTKFSRFHGTSVARDFVEAPSQMLENWCWEPKVLKQMSKHYKSGKVLPDDMINNLLKSRFANVGLVYLRQLFFGKFDIKLHTENEPSDPEGLTKLWADLREKISLVKGHEKPAAGEGTFAHIVGGYDAGYYGYMYSLVFASDMYETVFKKNPLDSALGKKYREEVLKPGGSQDDLDTLKRFLGRPPNANAFMKQLFGSDSS